MLKEELMDCVEQAYSYSKKLIVMWNDYKMQQIRLETANLRKIEQYRQLHIEEMDERKTQREKAQDNKYMVLKSGWCENGTKTN